MDNPDSHWDSDQETDFPDKDNADPICDLCSVDPDSAGLDNLDSDNAVPDISDLCIANPATVDDASEDSWDLHIHAQAM